MSLFSSHFQTAPAFTARAPGRVNLLGEHVDYNDGFVLPAAIDRAAEVTVAPTTDGRVTIVAADFNDRVTFRLDQLAEKTDESGQPLKGWARYPAGVAWVLQQQGLAVHGFNAVLTSNVPRGSGLSSSAAVEVAFATAWQHLGDWALAPMDKAKLCQQAENQYVGVNCGIMDQFASACGAAGQLLLLDCRALTWETVPLPDSVAIVVADTTARRELGNSEYNLRRAHCEAAARELSLVLPGIRALRDVSVLDFNRYASRLEPIVAQRARHVVEECERAPRAVQHLRAGEVAAFGQLMNACHASLRDLYEVSCPELNVMVEVAQTLPGCYGARLTGAGFGGCTVNLVAAAQAEVFTHTLAERYTARTGKTPEIYVCQAAEGAQVV
jgi:galactokinase